MKYVIKAFFKAILLNFGIVELVRLTREVTKSEASSEVRLIRLMFVEEIPIKHLIR